MPFFAKIWHLLLKRPFRLNYWKYGLGRQDVVLLHGIASDHTIWLPLVEQLAGADYRVIAPDLLGHGSSPKPDFITYSSDDQARAVLALLKRLHSNQAIVVGHSMGCLVASRLATINPGAVKKLILYEPPLFTDLEQFKTRGQRREFYRTLYTRIADNPSGTITRLVGRLAKNWSKYLASDQAWLPIERSLHNTILRQGSYDELKDTAISTDIVHGSLDIVVPRWGIKRALSHNDKIAFHKTTDRHIISRSSAKFLAGLIGGQPAKGKSRLVMINSRLKAIVSKDELRTEVK